LSGGAEVAHRGGKAWSILAKREGAKLIDKALSIFFFFWSQLSVAEFQLHYIVPKIAHSVVQQNG
jgi:hypothetical protein